MLTQAISEEGIAGASGLLWPNFKGHMVSVPLYIIEYKQVQSQQREIRFLLSVRVQSHILEDMWVGTSLQNTIYNWELEIKISGCLPMVWQNIQLYSFKAKSAFVTTERLFTLIWSWLFMQFNPRIPTSCHPSQRLTDDSGRAIRVAVWDTNL